MEGLHSAEQIKRLLSYNPETGVFVWVEPTARRMKKGDVAGGDCGHGYIKIFCEGRPYYAHRLAWFWVTGEWPRAHIDHINGDRSDNRWCNLREATNAENMRNAGTPKHNRTGFKGVHICKKTGRYRSQIFVKGRSIKLGRFDTAEEAHKAYQDAALRYFGTFARAA